MHSVQRAGGASVQIQSGTPAQIRRRVGRLTSVAPTAATGPAPLLLLRTTATRLLTLLGGVDRAASPLRHGCVVSLPLGAARKQAGAAITFVGAICSGCRLPNTARGLGAT